MRTPQIQSLYSQVLICICSIFIVSQCQGALKFDSTSLRDTVPLIVNDLVSNEVEAFKFVGGGDYNNINQSDNGVENTANLSLGLYMRRTFKSVKTRIMKDIEIDFAINIASTAQYLNGNERIFGNYILNPSNTSQSARLDMYTMFHNYRDRHPNTKGVTFSDIIEGAYLRFYGGNALWDNGMYSTNTSAYNLKFGLLHEFLPNQLAASKNVSVLLGIGYSFRWVAGDVIQNDGELLEKFIGINKRRYDGIEIMFGVKFGNIRAEFLVPLIASSQEVNGLTNAQFLTTVRFLGGFDVDYKD